MPPIPPTTRQLSQKDNFGADRSRNAPQVDRAHFAAGGSPYADAPQPLSHGATISAPHMHAHALSHLLPALRPGARALDVGSGSGYLTAVLGCLVGPTGAAVGLEHVGALARGAEQSVRKSEAGRKMVEEGRVRFVVTIAKDGTVIRTVNQVHVGEKIKVKLMEGELNCVIDLSSFTNW